MSQETPNLAPAYDWRKSAMKAVVAAAFVLAGALATTPPEVVAGYLPIADPWTRTLVVGAILALARYANNWLKNRDK